MEHQIIGINQETSKKILNLKQRNFSSLGKFLLRRDGKFSGITKSQHFSMNLVPVITFFILLVTYRSDL